jgi:hypothetical protein
LKFAVLIHLLDWQHNQPEFIIDNDISLISLEGHPVDGLYKRLCKETGLDESDPYIFNTALLLYDNNAEDISILPSGAPYSLSSTFLNLLTVIHGGTLGHCRVISSKDDFKTCWRTYELYEPLGEDIYNLQVDNSKVDTNDLYLLQKISLFEQHVWNSHL